MKIFEITENDIDILMNSRISLLPENTDFWEKNRQELKSQLLHINQILDDKYNKPREKGKSRQHTNAYFLNKDRKQKTFETIQAWYKNVGGYPGNERLTLVKIAEESKLHVLTIRNFLETYNAKLKLGHSSIAKNVIDILDKTFSTFTDEDL